jgi:hypothetical protein
MVLLTSTLPADDPERILYLYYERIMADIFDENANFADFPYKKQRDIVYGKVTQIKNAQIKPNLSIALSNDSIPNATDSASFDENDPRTKLRGSVGGVTGIVAIAQAVSEGTMTPDAGSAILVEMFGIDPTTAKKITSVPPPEKRAKEAAAAKGENVSGNIMPLT